MPDEKLPIEAGEILLYQTEDGRTRLEPRFSGDTIWLSLTQMAELFQRDKSVISRHIRNIYAEGELVRESTVAEFATVQTEGSREVARRIEMYHLDVVIAVGYRVRSHRGTQFRVWATERLREYVIKGFTLDDARLKQAGGEFYFDELLARIRDIRSSEKVFWRKVLEIYATSIDYEPKLETSQRFFATVQNKMHWAVHGQTAAEVIYRRADAGKPDMGLSSYPGVRPRAQDVGIAKNYLTLDELEALNRMVNAYLEFAELQALNRRPMYMADWIAKLDDFLRLSDRDILSHAGTVSHDQALERATNEYEKFSATQATLPSRAERDFEQTIRKLPKAAPESASKPPRKPKKS